MLEDRVIISSPREGFLGCDLRQAEENLSLGHFLCTDHVIPNEKHHLVRRGEVADYAGAAPAAVIAILASFTYQGDPADEALVVVSRTALTDALYSITASTWTLIGALPATGATYDMVQYRDQVFILDGTNPPEVYDPTGPSITTLVGTNIPTAPQYGTAHQDRLILADPAQDLVFFSDVLDETTFGALNFLNANTQLGDLITGLAVSSLTTGTRASQKQLITFKERSVLNHDGTLGSSGAELKILSADVGCPSINTAKNTHFGLVFLGQRFLTQAEGELKRQSVYIIESQGAREPQELGEEISSLLTTGPTPGGTCAVVHGDFYKLAFETCDNEGGEYFAELRQDVVIQRQDRRWWGPHIGNPVSSYIVFGGRLLAMDRTQPKIWSLDADITPATFGTMAAPSTTKEWEAVGPRLVSPDGRFILWEAFVVEIGAEEDTSLDVTFQSDDTAYEETISITVGTQERISLVFHPRVRARTMRVILKNSQAHQLEIFNLRWRLKQVGRQVGT